MTPKPPSLNRLLDRLLDRLDAAANRFYNGRAYWFVLAFVLAVDVLAVIVATR